MPWYAIKMRQCCAGRRQARSTHASSGQEPSRSATVLAPHLRSCPSIWHAARPGGASSLGNCPSCPGRLAALVLASSERSHAHLMATTLHQDSSCRGCNGVGDLSGGILEIVSAMAWATPTPPTESLTIGGRAMYLMPISFCISSHSHMPTALRWRN